MDDFAADQQGDDRAKAWEEYQRAKAWEEYQRSKGADSTATAQSGAAMRASMATRGAGLAGSDVTAQQPRDIVGGIRRQSLHRETIPNYSGQNEAGVVGSLFSKALSGMTFGVSDKVMAGADAYRDMGEGMLADASNGEVFGAFRRAPETLVRAFNDNLDARKAASAQVSREHPVLSLGAEVAGGVVNPANRAIAGIGPANPAGFLGRTGKAMAQGGVMGAGYGVGGADWRKPGETRAHGVIGAGAGALLGGAVNLVPETGRALATVARMRPDRSGRPSVSATIGDRLGVTSRQDIADEKTLGILEDAGLDPARLYVPDANGVLRARGEGSNLTVGELAGSPGINAMRAVNTMGGPGAKAMQGQLTRRANTTLDRTVNALERAAGTGKETALSRAEAINEAMNTTAAPHYLEAYSHGPIRDPNTLAMLDDLVNLPEGAGGIIRSAYQHGRMTQAMNPSTMAGHMILPSEADIAGLAARKAAARAAQGEGQAAARAVRDVADADQHATVDAITERQLHYLDRLKQANADLRAAQDPSQLRASAFEGGTDAVAVSATERINAAKAQLSDAMTNLAQLGQQRAAIRTTPLPAGPSAGPATEGMTVEGESLLPREATGKLRRNKDTGRWELLDPRVQDVDLLKRGLDGLVRSGQKVRFNELGEEGIVSGDLARGVTQRVQALRQAVDGEVPAYGLARATYGGEAALKDALQQGQEFGRGFTRKDMKPEQFTEALNALDSAAEKETFRVGVVDELRATLGTTGDGRSFVSALFGSDSKRKALKAMFPDAGEYRAFVKQMHQMAVEHRAKGQILGGSQTANKGEEKDELFGDALGQLLLPGNVIGWSPKGIVARGLAMGRMAGDVVSGKGLAEDVGRNLRVRPSNETDFADFAARMATASERRTGLGQAAATRGRVGAGAGIQFGNDVSDQASTARRMRRRP